MHGQKNVKLSYVQFNATVVILLGKINKQTPKKNKLCLPLMSPKSIP